MRQKKDLLESETSTKKLAKQVSVFYKSHLSNKGYKRFVNCGAYLEFGVTLDHKHKKLLTANFCHLRFCPICARGRAAKDAIELGVICKKLESTNSRLKFLFLTLTVVNVEADELGITLDRISNSYKRMIQNSPIFSGLFGTYRKLEVTYNYITNTYHPHLHVLLAIDQKYLTGRNRLTRVKVLDVWKRYYGDSRITQVNIQTAKGDFEFELAKYLTKFKDIKNREVFDTLFNAIGMRKIITKSGVFKTEFTMLHKNPLSFAEFLDADKNIYLEKLIARWDYANELYKKEYKPLTEKEKYKLNNSIEYLSEKQSEKIEINRKATQIGVRQFKQIIKSS